MNARALSWFACLSLAFRMNDNFFLPVSSTGLNKEVWSNDISFLLLLLDLFGTVGAHLLFPAVLLSAPAASVSLATTLFGSISCPSLHNMLLQKITFLQMA